MKKVLPLQDPPLKGFLLHAYPLSIVTSTEESKPWLYSNYVQIWCNQSLFERTKELRIDFYEGAFGSFKNYPIPWLDTFKLHNRLIDPQQIIEHLVEWINSGHYVYLFVDEYYIPDRIHHVDGTHYPHPVLVHGYDKEQQVLHISGYDQKQHYRQTLCSFTDFTNAYMALYAPEQQRKYSDEIYLLTINKEIGRHYTLDLKLLSSLLDDYLQARDSCDRLRMFFKLGDHVYGIGVYAYMIRYLDELLAGNIPFDIYYEIRPFHNFWEHKRFMLDRLRYLNANGIISLPIVQAFAEVEEQARRVRWLLMKYAKRPSEKPIEEMKVLLNDMREREQHVLTSVRDELNARLSG